MSTERPPSRTRRRLAGALLASPLALPWAARAAAPAGPGDAGVLTVALYENLPPYCARGRGIEVELAQALAQRLGVQARLLPFMGGEDMQDDLRNMVWKGHPLGTGPADVMLHVPVDPVLARQNEAVRIFAPYAVEWLAVTRDPRRVGRLEGPASSALAPFAHEPVGVERGTPADALLMQALDGKVRPQVHHYGGVPEALAALRRGEVAAVIGPRGELEGGLAALPGREASPMPVEALALTDFPLRRWALGMAVKRDRQPLAEALQEALAALQAEGTLARLFAAHGVRWVGA